MKKLTAAFLVTVMCIGLTACGGQSEEPAESEEADAAAEEQTEEAAPEDKGTLMMATTTSTEDTGLLDYLQPLFKGGYRLGIWSGRLSEPARRLPWARAGMWTLSWSMPNPARRNLWQRDTESRDFRLCTMILSW